MFSNNMRVRSFLLLTALAVLSGCRFWLPALQPNPDPNHTHADFAVWTRGEKLDFSDATYMSGSSKEPAGEHPDDDHKHPTLHLHDGVGHVIHSHKPGQPFGDFFASIGFSIASEKPGEYCWYALSANHPFSGCESGPMHLYVNKLLFYGENPLDYIFNDGDHLLLTDAVSPEALERELAAMTDDACRYSQTCPRRGRPPLENCVADPAVPCTE